ncbi:lysozyme-like [Linepithema humile]|uniref:lysozyme-like n=1 Tax=Linepithema humile TaxID=83485 RepID=UPI000623A4D8|nr:PREDICTED: lysozyme-like [Linepithema humile]
MGKVWILFILMVITVYSSVDGKILTQCELVKELERSKISRSLFSNWVCLVQSESRMDTRLVTGPKTASSYSYGILQINSAKWCTRGRKGGICNKRCEDFLHDNIQEDIECAKIIVNRDGFKAWDGWTKKCKNKALPIIGNCRRRRMVIKPESDPVIV